MYIQGLADRLLNDANDIDAMLKLQFKQAPLNEDISVKIHNLTIFKGEFELATGELRDWILTAEMDGGVLEVDKGMLDTADDWIVKMTQNTVAFTGALKAAKMKSL